MNPLPSARVILLLFLVACAAGVWADDEPWAPAPPRLSFIDGEVSYWRPGAAAWASASANLPLTLGDALYAGKDANFEVQFGSRSFVRADEDTQLSLLAQQEQAIQFKVAAGRVSFDIRSMVPHNRVEVSTPNAVFVIEAPGYYRVEVDARETHFITRRGGEATLITADGRSLSIYPSEEIVVTAGTPVKVATYAAPLPDDWDRWNDARSDRLGESTSARYVPAEVYGVEELDRYGRWRVVPTYGAVWIPYGVSPTWVPYSTGYWVWDPYYEWTWVDYAPWGWAPFHYGRWVYIDSYWAWAPGPVVRRPIYSPALVAFLIRDGSVSARISIGTPGLWWVALSWGEPIVPWWGPSHYRGRPYWRGWGGPRIVNNVVIQQTTVINVRDIRYHNATLPRTLLTVPTDKFGRERTRATVETRYRHTDLAPAHGQLPVKPTQHSLLGGAPRAAPPPQEIVNRPVVTRQMPREPTPPWQPQAAPGRTPAAPTPRYVIPPERKIEDRRALPRPPFGAETGPELTPPPRPPRYDEIRKVTPPAAPGILRSPERTTPPATPLATPREPARPPLGTTPREPARPPLGTTPREPARPPLGTTPREPARPPLGTTPREPARPPLGTTPREPAQPSSPPARGTERPEGFERPLPGQPANQPFWKRSRE